MAESGDDLISLRNNYIQERNLTLEQASNIDQSDDIKKRELERYSDTLGSLISKIDTDIASLPKQNSYPYKEESFKDPFTFPSAELSRSKFQSIKTKEEQAIVNYNLEKNEVEDLKTIINNYKEVSVNAQSIPNLSVYESEAETAINKAVSEIAGSFGTPLYIKERKTRSYQVLDEIANYSDKTSTSKNKKKSTLFNYTPPTEVNTLNSRGPNSNIIKALTDPLISSSETTDASRYLVFINTNSQRDDNFSVTINGVNIGDIIFVYDNEVTVHIFTWGVPILNENAIKESVASSGSFNNTPSEWVIRTNINLEDFGPSEGGFTVNMNNIQNNDNGNYFAIYYGDKAKVRHTEIISTYSGDDSNFSFGA